MEDIDVEALGDAPRPPGVGIGRHALEDDAARRQRQGPVDDVGMAGDPADVGHAPIDVLGVDVLDVFGGAGGISEIAAGAVLASLGLAGGAAGVHQEQRRLGRHRHRLDPLAGMVLEHIVDDEIAALDHRRRRRGLAGVALPHQHLVDGLAGLFRHLAGDVGVGLVVDQLAAAMIGVGGDQHGRARIGDPLAAGLTGEAAEHLGMDDSEPGAGQHRHRQFRHHRHVKRHPVAGLEPGEVAQQRRELVHPHVKLLIGDDGVRLVLRFGDVDQRRLVLVSVEVAVDAVEAGIQLAADEPLPARRVGGIERRLPTLDPGQEIGVFLEAIGKIIEAEALVNPGIRHVRLGDERRRWGDLPLFLPMDLDLRFARVGVLDDRLVAHEPVSLLAILFRLPVLLRRPRTDLYHIPLLP